MYQKSVIQSSQTFIVLVSVPDPFSYAGNYIYHLHFANEYRLKNAREGTVGLKRTCACSTPLPSPGDTGT